MKKLFLATLTTSICILTITAQEIHTPVGDDNYYESIPPVKLIFLESMPKPINSASPTSHPLLDNDWYYDLNASDEFNGTSLDLNKWTDDYKWGNTYLQHLAHNRQDLANHDFDGNNLIIRNVDENFSQRMIGYHSSSTIESDGKPNFRELPYTSAMIMSKESPENALNQPYGFIEIRCKIPKSKYIMANFWLWSAGTDSEGEEFYDEIDIFETNDGITMHQTTHYFFEDFNPTNWYHHHQVVWPEDGTYFSDAMNTYAVKWEPNKIVYYLNNKVMRIVTEHVPGHKMDIILDMAFRQENGPLSVLTLDPYIIDYIRVFHRNDYGKPDPVFSINGENSYDFSSPILVDINSNLIMNAEESYSIDNAYFIGIQEVNSAGLEIGNGISTWLLNTSINDIKHFDIKSFCQSNGLGLNANSTYKLKLVPGGGDWIENVQYFKITPHQNSINFTINGSINSQVNIKNVPSYQDIPRIIIDGSKSSLGGYDFEIYLEPANSSGQVIGTGVSQWFLDQPETLKEFNLRSFAASKGFTLEYGNYYKVSICTANPWLCDSKIIFIEPCTNFIDFEINGMQSEPIIIVSEYNEPDIILTTALSNSCFSDDYFIGIQNSNSNGDYLSGGVGDWIIPTMEFEDITSFWDLKSSFIDLRKFTSDRNFNLVNGNYYLVKVATGSPWTEKTKLLYIDACTSNPDFTIEGQKGTIVNPVEISCDEFPKVRLSAWEGTACDNYYFLALWNCDNVGNCTEIANQWLPTELVDNMKNTNLTSLAYYDLYDHFQDSPFNTTLNGYNYYKITLCTGFDGWKCEDVYIHMNQPDCGFLKKDSTTEVQTTINPSSLELSDFEVYPNPTSGSFIIKFNSENHFERKFSIVNSLGKEIYQSTTNGREETVDLSNKPGGIYFIKVENKGLITTKKIVKY